MPVLRQAATRWHDQNLRGTTAITKDSVTVRFARKGMGKSTSAGKGDILLRSVPAIRSIIESGEVVLREPGNWPGIMERFVILVFVRIAWTVRLLEFSVHRVPHGSYEYELTYDRNVDGKKPGVDSGGLAQRSLPLPSLEVPLLAAGGPGVGVPGGLMSTRGMEVGREGAASGVKLFDVSGQNEASARFPVSNPSIPATVRTRIGV